MNARKSLVLPLGILGFCSLLSAPAQGPDDKGAVLRSPFDAPPPATAIAPQRPVASPNAAPLGAPAVPQTSFLPTTPSYLKSIFPEAQPVDPASPNARRPLTPDTVPDINRDLQITPAAGNWLVLVISYTSSPGIDGKSGRDGAAEVRKMCLEVRAKHRVPAYVFVYGAEERRKEYERVKKLLDQQQAFFKEKNLWPEEPLRAAIQHIDVQHAVLIGGYPDDESAKKALTTIKNWPQPDEKKVALEVKYYKVADPKDPSKTVRDEHIYVNPFKRAFVCRNPTVKHEAVQEAKLDPAVLRRMNSEEPYSLFNCKKPYTLAVKEFQTPYRMHDRATPANLWITGAAAEQKDFAGLNAHAVADWLRKSKLEAYVLHSKFSSSVTVGGFDSPNDPLLIATQDKLAKCFNEPPFTVGMLSQIQFFPRPVPMAVPR